MEDFEKRKKAAELFNLAFDAANSIKKAYPANKEESCIIPQSSYIIH